MNKLTNPLIEVSILVDGSELPIYQDRGGIWFVEGTPGKSYAIAVRNASGYGNRLEIVESVDGRDVLRDEAARLNSSGMIIASRECWLNRGWRLNDDQVREFVFSDPSSSIAAQATGSTLNVGVIGIAVYREKRTENRYAQDTTVTSKGWPGIGTYVAPDFAGTSVTASRSPSFAAADLGTGMGDLQSDHVNHTSFARASSTPDASVIEIHYRTHDWLVQQGIIGPAYPSAFPGSDTGYGKYAK